MHDLHATIAHALNYFVRWMSFHRIAIMFSIGVFLWLSAYYLYFGKRVRKALKKSAPGSWSVELARRKTYNKAIWKPTGAVGKKPKPNKPGG